MKKRLFVGIFAALLMLMPLASCKKGDDTPDDTDSNDGTGGNSDGNDGAGDDDDNSETRAPAVNLGSIFGNLGNFGIGRTSGQGFPAKYNCSAPLKPCRPPQAS